MFSGSRIELWRTGIGTPDDPGDDVRLIMLTIDDGDDDVYSLESWGSSADGTCSGDCEHSVSDGDDDPFTDWIYWIEPIDDSPGEAGYLAAEADMLAGTFADNFDDHYGGEIMARTVLVGLDAGKEPPFAMNYPEQGTVFRITTAKPETPPDTFAFTAAPPPYYVTSLEGSSVYIKYKLYNKGNNVIKDMYLGYWSDPDLGTAGDDFVGCDTLNNIWFCYNATDNDGRYGPAPPALGFKILYGPLVPAPGQTAYFDGQMIPNFENIGLTAFVKFIGGMDPDNFGETYKFMLGLTKTGDDYVYEGRVLTFTDSGDPVTGVGDIDIAPADRRMLAASGPFDLQARRQPVRVDKNGRRTRDRQSEFDHRSQGYSQRTVRPTHRCYRHRTAGSAEGVLSRAELPQPVQPGNNDTIRSAGTRQGDD